MVKSGLICPGEKIRFQHVESWHKTSQSSAVCVNCSLTIINLPSVSLTQVEGNLAANSRPPVISARKCLHGNGNAISIFFSQNINTKGDNSTILNNAGLEFQLQGTYE